jgi:hypothetical protein
MIHSFREVKEYFFNLKRSYYFINTTNFNMISMMQWVPFWRNISLMDCFDGTHQQVMVVPDDKSRVFNGIEDINHYLLDQPATQQLIQERKAGGHDDDQAIFLFFDAEIEAKCQAMQLSIALPPHQLVKHIDSKIVTTEIGNLVGVPSVPNVLATIGSYADLQRVASEAELGSQWVVQTAYGDSGRTTFFISSEADYNAVAPKVEAQSQVKVMRHIRCVGAAIEACATRWGTAVGPMLTELIGDPLLTPYAAGWCGNENHAKAFGMDVRAQVFQKTQAMGKALYQKGYRGTFEIDYLIDLDSHDIYLGEINARVTGITALTSMSHFSNRYFPLFLFHLLEFDSNVELKFNISEYNQAMLADGAQGMFAQMVLKHTDDLPQFIEQAPVTGVYTRQPNGSLILKYATQLPTLAKAEDEAFVLRIQSQGEYAYKGGDMAIVFVNQHIGDGNGQLNEVGQGWAHALKSCFVLRDLTDDERANIELQHQPANIKSGAIA